MTFLPQLQEFCIFAIVGLVSDYFLQMFFFSTVLSLNLKRVAVIAEVKKLPKMIEQSVSWQNRKSFLGSSFNRSISHPSQLSELDRHSQESVVRGHEKKIPKRLRIVNFWARTRFFQKGFIFWMILWISNIIYNSGIIETTFLIEKNNVTSKNEHPNSNSDNLEAISSYDSTVKNLSNIMKDYYIKNWNKKHDGMELNITDKIEKLKHPQIEISARSTSFALWNWESILKKVSLILIFRKITSSRLQNVFI